MRKLSLHYRPEPERDRWVPGDRWIRPLVRRVVRGAPRPGGLDKVFLNLRLGLDRLNMRYDVNQPYRRLQPGDRVAVLGRGRHCLDGYRRREPLVAGIGLMTHPSEWPTLLRDYPVACYLQHSEWAAAVYRPYFGDKCAVWPVGIDTDTWQPQSDAPPPDLDFLIYDKIPWERERWSETLVQPILDQLAQSRLSYSTVRYGHYRSEDYRATLRRVRAMIVLSPHESQGIAYQEALSAGVPLLAWDPGRCQDPARFKWGQPDIPTSSVPYFDERCGRRFVDFADFQRNLGPFLESLRGGRLQPRDYILENLTVEKCSQHFTKLLAQYLP
jgi:glycosyltransferase involved in cell wall biosynthesis